jgi:type IV secretory pathway TrbF-like protein
MAKFKVRVKAEAVVEIDPVIYQAEWEEHCYDAGDMEEGDEYPPVTEEFAFETYQENIENGNEDMPDFDTVEVARITT